MILKKNQISALFCNARECVRLGQARVARSYVLQLLDGALESYGNASTILKKAKLAAFMDHWIAVSRELYARGITDFVLESFGLPVKKSNPHLKTPPVSVPKPAPPSIAPASESPRAQMPSAEIPRDDDIDYSGLIEETKNTQGLCAEVFEKNKFSVAEIYVTGNGKLASGTGFIISGKGYLLTNDHVVYDKTNEVYYPKISMKLYSGQKRYRLEVLFSDRKTDIALCRFDPEEVGKFASIKSIADYSSLQQGADCILIGNGFGMGLAPFSGEVRYTKDSDGNLVHTAPSNPGDSGAPVFNRQGECIGVNKSKTVKINAETAASVTISNYNKG